MPGGHGNLHSCDVHSWFFNIQHQHPGQREATAGSMAREEELQLAKDTWHCAQPWRGSASSGASMRRAGP
jgi:hypothetical protein